MKIDQSAYLEDLRGKIRSQREQLKSIHNADPEVLTRRINPDSWTAAECINHLSKTYALYIPRVDEVISRLKPLDSNQVFRSGWIGHYSIKNTSPNSKQRIRMKMKTFDFFQPQADVGFNEALRLFQDDLLWHEDVLIQSERLDLTHNKVQSAARWLKFRLGDAYAFLLAHNDRHLLQA